MVRISGIVSYHRSLNGMEQYLCYWYKFSILEQVCYYLLLQNCKRLFNFIFSLNICYGLHVRSPYFLCLMKHSNIYNNVSVYTESVSGKYSANHFVQQISQTSIFVKFHKPAHSTNFTNQY